MPYKLRDGETARDAARELLGDGNLFHDLRAPGWDGNPDNVRPGMEFRLDGERNGPPARHMLNPQRWGVRK